MKQPKWSQIDGLCRAVEAVAGGDTRCWVEQAGDVVAGNPPDRPITPSGQDVGGSESDQVVAVVSGLASRTWIHLLATIVRSALAQQSTIQDMAAATARGWRQMNALLAMASSSSLGVEAGKTIQRIFDTLVRATRFDGGIAVVRVPGSEECLQLDAGGVQRLPQEIVEGLDRVGTDVYTFALDAEPDDLRRACDTLLDPYRPAAVARLQTENECYGWLLAAAAEESSSDDLKLFGAAARLTAIALENSHTLTMERAATRLEVEKELYQALAKTAPVGMFRTDASGRVLYVSDRWCRVSGASEAEALREGWLCAVHPDDRARVNAEWEQMLVEGTSVRCEHRCRRTDRVVWVFTEIAREAREEGGYVGTLTDITDRKRTEQEKAELEEHLRHAHKMEAVGTMAGGIAHDFNNILGAMVGNAELAIERVPEGDRARVHLDRLLKGAFRARELIGQLLAFSRQTERVRVAHEAGPVVSEALDLLRASIPTNVELRAVIAAPEARVSADAGQLHQVILNLCRNACEAVGDGGGQITVELDRCNADAETVAPHAGTLAPGGYVRLAVTDSGPGVSEEVQARIFEPFFTTKAMCGGSGMGLAMVHGIVADHGGSVRLSNVPGGGARFEVYLPEHNEQPCVAGETAALDPTGPRPEGIETVDASAASRDGDDAQDTEGAGSLEDLVAEFLAEETGAVPANLERSDAAAIAEPAPQHVSTVVGASLAPRSQPAVPARLRGAAGSELACAIQPSNRATGASRALPAPENLDGDTSRDTGARADETLLERLVAEFLAEEEQAPNPTTGAPSALSSAWPGGGVEVEVAGSQPVAAATNVPAVRGAAVAVRRWAIERAPEFRPGHARLLGSARARGARPELPAAAARAIAGPSSGAQTGEAIRTTASVSERPEPVTVPGAASVDATAASSVAKESVRPPLPFPYGMPPL